MFGAIMNLDEKLSLEKLPIFFHCSFCRLLEVNIRELWEPILLHFQSPHTLHKLQQDLQRLGAPHAMRYN